MCENSEKCPSNFPRTQGDAIGLLILSNQLSKNKLFTVTLDKVKQPNLAIETNETDDPNA